MPVEKYVKCVEKGVISVEKVCEYLINVLGACDLSEHNIRTALLSTPGSQNPHTSCATT